MASRPFQFFRECGHTLGHFVLKSERRTRALWHSSLRRYVVGFINSNQGGKVLKWLPAHFNFSGSVVTLWDTLSSSRSVGRGTGAFIYALSADETSPTLAAPRHAITSLLSCCFKCPCPPGWQPHFRSNADRAYNTLHFASKVVCQRDTLWKPFFVGVCSHTSSKMQISGIGQPVPGADLYRLFAYMGFLLYRPYKPFQFITSVWDVVTGLQI